METLYIVKQQICKIHWYEWVQGEIITDVYQVRVYWKRQVLELRVWEKECFWDLGCILKPMEEEET